MEATSAVCLQKLKSALKVNFHQINAINICQWPLYQRQQWNIFSVLEIVPLLFVFANGPQWTLNWKSKITIIVKSRKELHRFRIRNKTSLPCCFLFILFYDISVFTVNYAKTFSVSEKKINQWLNLVANKISALACQVSKIGGIFYVKTSRLTLKIIRFLLTSNFGNFFIEINLKT